MLTREIPFLRILFPLCLGIITGLFFTPGHKSIVLFAVISFACLAISMFFKTRIRNVPFGIIFFIALIIYGLILYSIEKESISDLKQESTVFTAVINDFPEEKPNSYLLTLKLDKIISNSSYKAVKGSMLVYFSSDSLAESFKPGNIIVFRATPLPVENKGNPCEFNYRFYLQSKGIKYYSFIRRPDICSIASPESVKLKHRALIIRNRIISEYEKAGITGKRLAIVSAITLGEKSQLDDEQKENFIKAGVMHIMAVSGLHAVILSLFIFKLLFFLKGRYSFIRITVTVAFLWGFAFITGLTPSVLRATLMFSFLQAGNLMKRRINGINSVLASAFVLILVRPSVIFDAGFLLSYSAVLFIIGFYREFYNLFIIRNRIADWLWQSAVVTTVAQSGTLPLTIMLFNRFPVWFFLTNIVIVPVSSIVIITGCLVILTLPLPAISGYIAVILDRLAWLTDYLTGIAAGLPSSTINLIGLTVPECAVLFLSIATAYHSFLKNSRMTIKYPLIFFLVFLLISGIKYLTTFRNSELIVYNTPGLTTVGVRSGKILFLFTDSPVIPPAAARHISTMALKVQMKSLSGSPVCLKAGSHHFIITDSLNFRLPHECSNTTLIMTGKYPHSPEKIKRLLPGPGRIITTAATEGFSPQIAGGEMESVKFWSVRKSGAYRERL